jgi:hypothetical protein
MKKMMILGGVVLFLALVVLLGCATVPIKSITEADLPDLKGKWKGDYQVQGYSKPVPVALEINEYLQGWMTMVILEGSGAGFPFYGSLEKGRIVYSWRKGEYINLNLRKGEGKMKLQGDCQFRDSRGTMFLDKIKE